MAAAAPTATRGRFLAALPGSRVHEVLATPMWPKEWPFSQEDFLRADEQPDSVFYEPTRLVFHIDDKCVAGVTKYYKEAFEEYEKPDVLDICSSWVSHFPEDFTRYGNRVGLGMNADELAQNKQLDSYVQKDLNVDPTLPFDEASFDIVTCVVSVDYLTKPLEVFREIQRVLKPGGVAIMSISNRCFPTKAIGIWLQTNDLEHVFIVGSYFHYAGGFEAPEAIDRSPGPFSDPLFIIRAKKPAACA